MKEHYRDLSELLQHSTPAEAYFSQLSEEVQAKAMAHSGMIHSTRNLKAMAKLWGQDTTG